MELPALIIWIVVNLFDLHSSLVAIKRWGINVEKNGLARKFCKKFGLIRGVIIFKTIFVAVWSLIILFPGGWIGLWTGIGVVGYQTVLNYRIIKK